MFKEKNEFYGHHAKVVCLAWSPDNEHFATGGMDMMVYVWTVSNPDKRIKIPGNTHTRAHIFFKNCIVFLKQKEILALDEKLVLSKNL